MIQILPWQTNKIFIIVFFLLYCFISQKFRFSEFRWWITRYISTLFCPEAGSRYTHPHSIQCPASFDSQSYVAEHPEGTLLQADIALQQFNYGNPAIVVAGSRIFSAVDFFLFADIVKLLSAVERA